jgi:hypothetical protein
VARLGFEPESSSSLGTTLAGGPRLSARDREGRRELARGGLLGRGGGEQAADWAAQWRRKRLLAGPCRPTRLGWAGGRKGRERPRWARPQGGKRERKNRKREWVGPKEKKREKKNCIQMRLKLNLKFKFK